MVLKKLQLIKNDETKTFNTDILDILVILRAITSPFPQTDFINLVDYHNNFGIMQGFDTLFNSFQQKQRSVCHIVVYS